MAYAGATDVTAMAALARKIRSIRLNLSSKDARLISAGSPGFKP